MELKNFEKVGDLHAKLDELDAARGAWKQAVDRFVLNRDALNAARICDVRLQEPDAAIDALLVGWRSAWQAEQCLVEMFRLLGRLGRRESSLRRLDVLRERNDPADREPSPQRELPFAPRLIVSGLAAIFEQYPDERVRATAADVARVATARALVSRHVEGHVCARLIERLAPADRLLGRDCRRYVGDRDRPKIVKAAVKRSARNAAVPALVSWMPHNTTINWKTAVSTARGIYVAGAHNSEIHLGRLAWGERREESWVSWNSKANFSDFPLLLAVDRDDRSQFVPILPSFRPPLPPRVLAASERFPKGVAAETPAWLAEGAVAIDASESLIWSLELPNHVVKCTDRTGVVLRSNDLRDAIAAYGDPPETHTYVLHARPGEAYVGVNRYLWRLVAAQQERHECPSAIRSIVGTAPYTRTRIAVFCEQGGEVWWPTHRGGAWARFDDEDTPLGTFLRDGRLVVCTQYMWRVYDTRRERLTLESESDAQLRNVWAVVRGPGANEFAVCPTDRILIYACAPAAAE